ncbi:hypothetical protein ACM66B_003440 [Microbotryomycetes sp. NB124-2]
MVAKRQRAHSVPCATALVGAWSWTTKHLTPPIATTLPKLKTFTTRTSSVETRSLKSVNSRTSTRLVHSAPLTPTPSRCNDPECQSIASRPVLVSRTSSNQFWPREPQPLSPSSSNETGTLTEAHDSLRAQAERLYNTPVTFVTEPRTGAMSIEVGRTVQQHRVSGGSRRGTSLPASPTSMNEDEVPPECTIM